MIVKLSQRASNDNAEREYWTCMACSSVAFLLEYDAGETIIRCAACRMDVTHFLKDQQCQP